MFRRTCAAWVGVAAVAATLMAAPAVQAAPTSERSVSCAAAARADLRAVREEADKWVDFLRGARNDAYADYLQDPTWEGAKESLDDAIAEFREGLAERREVMRDARGFVKDALAECRANGGTYTSIL